MAWTCSAIGSSTPWRRASDTPASHVPTPSGNIRENASAPPPFSAGGDVAGGPLPRPPFRVARAAQPARPLPRRGGERFRYDLAHPLQRALLESLRRHDDERRGRERRPRLDRQATGGGTK